MRAILTNPYLLVLVGGGVGSLLRYQAARWIPSTVSGVGFPSAILLVNVLASGILGIVMGWALSRSGSSDELRLLLGVGFCGGLSTFSTFSMDTMLLLQNGRWGAALLNISLNVICCLLASAVGFWLGQKL
ncbi:fluoride efflux transporter CrcB [Nibrella saemangeumensis]|uniref:Fluoride-specific ion channel FluC n=1 Tax=Nibrella saemangeumensis TaxID=1084526 RepID=A0ABP8MCB3_9BACT